MNKSILIEFREGGAVALLLGESVSGFPAVVQNAMVNLLTDAGTDTVFSARGTSLFRTALSGGIFNVRSASHACNFAAADTLFFGREYDVAVAADKLDDVSLRPTFLGISSLSVAVGFVAVDGRTMSFSIPIQA